MYRRVSAVVSRESMIISSVFSSNSVAAVSSHVGWHSLGCGVQLLARRTDRPVLVPISLGLNPAGIPFSPMGGEKEW